MSFEHRNTDDLIRIASAGGGFRLTARHRQTDDLIRIAAAAKNSGAQLIFTGLTHRQTEELIRIGSAGKGSVIFEG
jgi:hypothetical protein